MKPSLSILIIVFLGGCTPQADKLPHDNRGSAQTGSHAIGARKAAGTPVGDYRVIDAKGHVFAQGRFQNGKMDGAWLFFASYPNKLAEITYRDSAATGPYKMYYDSDSHPSAAGKSRTTGCFKAGLVTGEHIWYSATGTVISKATFKADHPKRVEVGSNITATRSAVDDEESVIFLKLGVDYFMATGRSINFVVQH